MIKEEKEIRNQRVIPHLGEMLSVTTDDNDVGLCPIVR